jgi:tetratricopeptide (TPR) repeat protein
MLEEALIKGNQHPLLGHLAGCPYCQSRLGELPDNLSRRADFSGASPSAPGVIVRLATPICCSSNPVDYGPAIERSERKYLEHASALHQERAEAPGLLTDLLAHRPEKRKLLLGNSSRFQTWGLYELLVDRSWKARAISRAEAEELARLAIHLGPHLDTSYYQREIIEDLQARAWSYVANLRRMASDFEGAEEAFQVAYSHLKQGTSEPLERAVFLDLKASLRGTQRRPDEARQLLRRAIAIFLHQGDDHRAGKSLLSLSLIHDNAGKPEDAIAVLQQSLRLIDPSQDERLLLCAWHNLIDYLTDLGRFIEAQGLYRKARPLYRKFAEDPEFGTRRLWVKGKIARGLGQLTEAETLFVAARARYLVDEIPYDAALVSMDLAILYADQDRTAELKQLATEVLTIFTSRHIHLQALAALTFLKQAVDAERLTGQMAAGIAKFLWRAAGDPSLKFEAPVS